MKIFTDYPNHDVRESLPEMTHQEWCRYLKTRGQLAETHRRCLHSDRCEAHIHASTGIDWRSNRL